MDPEACLLACETAIRDRDEDAAYDCLENYANWRRNGGFEPTLTVASVAWPVRGDEFHTNLIWEFEDTIGRYDGPRLS